MITILFVLLAASHAVEFLPCQRALTGTELQTPDGRRLRLEPDQIVVRGPLELFAEPGGGLNLSIIDLETRDLPNLDANEARHVLDDGDRLWVLNGKDQVIAGGYHLTRKLGPRAKPALLMRPGVVVRALPDEIYARLVAEGAPAVAIKRLARTRLNELDAAIARARTPK